MSDKNDNLTKIEYKIIFIYCIMFSLVFFSGVYFGSDMISNEVTAPQEFTYNNYINAAEWTEKCSDYEYYEEHEIDYDLERLEYINCKSDYDFCEWTIIFCINNDCSSDINDKIECENEYLTCKQKYGTPYIKTINKSRCVETILVKVI